MLTKLAIIGRPNVGKSTLFNRLIGKRKAVVHKKPGTTRDRNDYEVFWKSKKFIVTDTAGWDSDVSIFSKCMSKQLNIAIKKADLILFVVDAKIGLHSMDFYIAEQIRFSCKKTILVVNKVDTQEKEIKGYEFYELGLSDIVFISADHGRNIQDLLDKICEFVKYDEKTKENIKLLKIIFVGRPNVGKSSIINAIAGEERSIVHDVPGTTRDSITVHVKNDEKEYVLIDTAGIHRNNKIINDMEYLSTLSANYAIEDANVAVLVMDALQGIGEIEVKVSRLLLEKKKPVIIVLNKWDLIENKKMIVKYFMLQLREKIKFMHWVNIIFVSAKTGQRLDKIFYEVEHVIGEYSKNLNLKEFYDVIRDASIKKTYVSRGKVLKLIDYAQISSGPPVFVFFVNDVRLVHFSYKRFLENRLREKFGFCGTPIILKFKKYFKDRKTIDK
jgi:GTP-binding protein